jgi:hypothetical protein
MPHATQHNDSRPRSAVIYIARIAWIDVDHPLDFVSRRVSFEQPMTPTTPLLAASSASYCEALPTDYVRSLEPRLWSILSRIPWKLAPKCHVRLFAVRNRVNILKNSNQVPATANP